MRIPISKPLFGAEEFDAIRRPLESGWVVQGPFVKSFEERFARYTAARYAVATTSCTTALHLVLAALGLERGQEVIVPAFTWISTANVVEYAGATPIFCDINIETFNIDVAQMEALITPRTVGLLPVHLFGLAADMHPILSMAERHRLWVIEDAACAFGTYYHGVHAGCFGRAGCFSFHPRKSITTGEGGMVTTADPELDRVMRAMRDHGAVRSDFDRHQRPASFLLSEYPYLGYNYRMTDIQGALGCAQMDRAAGILEGRQRAARRYSERLAGLDWLRPPTVPVDYVHGYQAYVCLFGDGATEAQANVAGLHEQRNALMSRLEEKGIATRQGTHAAALQQFYRDKYRITPEQFPNAHRAERLSLTLPLYAQLTDAQQDFVCDTLVAEVARA